ncbi:MAG TPA: hypothetical protein VMG82_29580, partial [Candidatus Sulfotelmatobacter sp.]|nr:hypothetical protein [Candidatus Sulfotelmatobacter sp.]
GIRKASHRCRDCVFARQPGGSKTAGASDQFVRPVCAVRSWADEDSLQDTMHFDVFGQLAELPFIKGSTRVAVGFPYSI